MKNLLPCVLLLWLASTSFAQETEEQIKKFIIQDLTTYSKAVEYNDYNKVVEHFHYPHNNSGTYVKDK